jgi:hypothetical protein
MVTYCFVVQFCDFASLAEPGVAMALDTEKEDEKSDQLK